MNLKILGHFLGFSKSPTVNAPYKTWKLKGFDSSLLYLVYNEYDILPFIKLYRYLLFSGVEVRDSRGLSPFVICST